MRNDFSIVKISGLLAIRGTRSGEALGTLFAGAFIARCNIPLHS
jgi:hypothetical protein